MSSNCVNDFIQLPDPDFVNVADSVSLIQTPKRLYNFSKCPVPYISNYQQYCQLYTESIQNPEKFWGERAKELLDWIIPFKTILTGTLDDGDVAWFEDGYLNACYNCVDRHAIQTPDKVAIIYEPDEPITQNTPPNQLPPSLIKTTYKDLLKQVCQLANALKNAFNIKKGDIVAIYMPMVPEALVAMLACARIGAIHSVVFAGFQPIALRSRIEDGQCKVVITSDQGRRNGKAINTKKIVDEAISTLSCVKNVLVFKRTGDPSVPFNAEIDVWWHEEMIKHRPFCPIEVMNSEDSLFTLYTSGSTGKPKGLVHTTAGYLLGAALTVKHVFEVHDGDIFGCAADVGWITGHTYIVYGPLLLGSTTVVFESIPTYPTPSRYWQLIDQHKITQFYTAPTAIRTLRRLGDQHVEGFDLSSLRVLGSVGEPINPEAWKWFFEVVGKQRCAVVDTYWQTETGCHIITSLPCAFPAKPGSATLPFFGIDVVIVDSENGQEVHGNDVTGVLCVRKPWPALARTVFGDHSRYLETYMRPYRGYYFTGDGVTRDKDGYYWIQGRVDDVINVSGHRLSTAEIEAVLQQHDACAEAAVVGLNDDLTGQAVTAICTLKPDFNTSKNLITELILHVRTVISPIATPKALYIVPELPKTRSGKVMRRIIRKIAAKEFTKTMDGKGEVVLEGLGDLSTLADPSCLIRLVEALGQ